MSGPVPVCGNGMRDITSESRVRASPARLRRTPAPWTGKFAKTARLLQQKIPRERKSSTVTGSSFPRMCTAASMQRATAASETAPVSEGESIAAAAPVPATKGTEIHTMSFLSRMDCKYMQSVFRRGGKPRGKSENLILYIGKIALNL